MPDQNKLFQEHEIVDLYEALDANAEVEKAKTRLDAEKLRQQQEQQQSAPLSKSAGVRVGRGLAGAVAGALTSRMAPKELQPGLLGKLANISAGGVSGAAGTPQTADFIVSSLFLNNPQALQKLASKGPAARYASTAGWLLGGLAAGKAAGALTSAVTKEEYNPAEGALADIPFVAASLGIPALSELKHQYLSLIHI